MINVNKVFITVEVSEKLGITKSYLLRLSKKLKREGRITDNDMRLAGTRNYIFNQNAIREIEKQLEINSRKVNKK